MFGGISVITVYSSTPRRRGSFDRKRGMFRLVSRSRVRTSGAIVFALLASPLSSPCVEIPHPPSIRDSLKAMIGDSDYEKLGRRLKGLNDDIVAKGLHDFPGSNGKLLTGYAYGQFYDWDLYFENVYLSYYGVPDYCFNNFKAFIALQKPDGFIQRSFGPKPFGTNQLFKPFLAQIAILGS